MLKPGTFPLNIVAELFKKENGEGGDTQEHFEK